MTRPVVRFLVLTIAADLIGLGFGAGAAGATGATEPCDDSTVSSGTVK
ncbi:hypothetical protein JXA80_05580 [bacterium]|nr:hypothetical protein [candidate division CSSED10-310 bacterium]